MLFGIFVWLYHSRSDAFCVEIDEILINNALAVFSLIQSFHDLDQKLPGGKLVIDVSYFGWHVYSETDDLCGESSCPISVGDFVLSHSQVLPGIAPPVSLCYYFRSLKRLCLYVRTFLGNINICNMLV